MERNRSHFEQWVDFAVPLSEPERKLLFDPQTSGGLLMAVEATDANSLLADLLVAGEAAAIIGEVRPGGGRLVVEP